VQIFLVISGADDFTLALASASSVLYIFSTIVRCRQPPQVSRISNSRIKSKIIAAASEVKIILHKMLIIIEYIHTAKQLSM